MTSPYEECAECGHFPSWHFGWRRLLPWLRASACGAWHPDGVCPCPGWRSKAAITA